MTPKGFSPFTWRVTIFMNASKGVRIDFRFIMWLRSRSLIGRLTFFQILKRRSMRDFMISRGFLSKWTLSFLHFLLLQFRTLFHKFRVFILQSADELLASLDVLRAPRISKLFSNSCYILVGNQEPRSGVGLSITRPVQHPVEC
ncbi:maturase K [Striga asiatica]|uniref:Maturase K n=1 Tax=Striga asiatica TaxID=4170 RepID=A0A5A7PJ25_STRAF|nr:maturase K [Striga asiatica]